MDRVVIVGGGISGLATAWWLRDQAAGRADVTVLEAEPRTGGKVGTERDDGWLCEWGPASMLAGHQDTVDLLRGVGLGDSIVAASGAARFRYLFLRGRLRRLPVGPGDLIRGSAIRRRYLLRALLEPIWHGRRPSTAPEPLARLIARHFGEGPVRDLLGPFVSGVFAGDPERLDAEAAFPGLYRIERNHGSIVRGLLRERRASRRSAPPPARAADGDAEVPRKGLLSLRGGLGSLIEQLTASLGEQVRRGSRVVRLSPPAATGDGEAWSVGLEDGGEIAADQVVVATPAGVASRLIGGIDEEGAALLERVESARAVTVGLGYAAGEIDVPRGFGVLVPRGIGVRMLGCLFESQLFEGRAPEGHELLRCILGGATDQEVVDQREEDLVAHARDGISQVLGVRAEPRRIFVRRHRLGIPQYHPGHAERQRRLEARIERHPGLHLTGDSYRGISVNDCIREARRTARAILSGADVTGGGATG